MTLPRSGLAARVHAVGAALGCTAAEALALALMAGGTVVALALLWVVAGDGGLGDLAPDGAAGGQPPGGLAIEPVEEELVVHVAGRVERPGLQRLPVGSRVADALEAAGGPGADAVLDTLNLARLLQDGEQLLVPGPLEGAGGSDGGGGGGAAASSAVRPDGTLDLNRASAAELEELPGIGPVMAARIVEHREQHGPFTVLGDLRQVRGVGEKTFQSLVELLSL
jgi:competence protein ComEA